MARVEYKSTPGGILQRRNGDVRPDVLIEHEGTGPVYEAATGLAELDAEDLVTSDDGEVPGWLEPGTYTTTDPSTGKAVTFAVGDGSVADVAALEADVAAIDAAAVKLTGAQAVAGIKTFSSSPVLPTPTAGDATTKAANMAAVAAEVALDRARLDSVERSGLDLGNLGAARTLDLDGHKESWLRGTMNANLTVTLDDISTRSMAILILTQDATGGRTLTVSDGADTQAVDIATTPSTTSIVYVYSPDGDDLYLNVASGTAGPQGAQGPTGPQGIQGLTGPTGPSGQLPLYGLLADRPSVGTAGDKALYFATDQSGGTLYQVQSGAWAQATKGVTAAPAAHAASHAPGGADALPLRTGMFGDGFHGAAVLDGTATVSWATLAGSVYTLNKNTYLTDLAINAGVTLDVAGFRLMGSGTFSGAGTISRKGSAGAASTTAAGGAGAAATANGYLIGSTAGGTGATAGGAAAAVGAAIGGTVNMGGLGGAGGAGSSTAGGASGNGGGAAAQGNPNRDILVALNGSFTAAGVVRSVVGGCSGGGGGAAAASQGGGGGGQAGGIVIVAFSVINFTGTIDVSGGTGGAANTAAGGGGGGGGGGGVIYMICQRLQSVPTVNVAGGAGGAGSNANGAAGAVGQTITLVIA